MLIALATSPRFERAVAALPGARARAWRSARRYVAGAAADDALRVAGALADRGLRASIDLFGEGVTDPAVATTVAAAYVRLAATLPPGAWLSIDLSHIAFDPVLLARVAAALPPGARVQVGAEEPAVTDRVLDAVVDSGGGRADATLQANLRRSPRDARRLAGAGVPVRLVKGAYAAPASEAHEWGPATDAAFAELALGLRDAGGTVRLATHDDALLERLLPALPEADCEVLLGVRPELATSLVAAGRRVRVYVPYGPDWFRYFMRRRAESHGA
jgi:proline dehydrogenase